ncbi:NAD-dependent epimerase/dehydratase family protein [Colwellia hornerae]|uniref:NAD(P)-dependent oxidoreductase n=1 Tax=Colwellia hornerae TaxID=89402 RepID=A0A5C6QJR5_9GAMM|nr:NAD(P)-dependent oxidoreductase [Colwellia hornerae]TWX54050.1 NAD(P)-dependent oxidoreductase [Colwellia hornerae]TWX60825.1 NAD(P)-dependent oxidoreductase [Colwellia hornerae]TWX69155.1 NAD(P)-dependent oxidoreductase [Colwellia hornerae]
MNILITGGLGNIGLWLTSYFLDGGHQVSVLGRNEKVKVEHENYRYIQADITCSETLSNAIDCYYDTCIHTASYNEHFQKDYSKKAVLINSLGTELLCIALKKYGVGKLVYLSTFHVYGQAEGVVTEKSSISPNNDYGLTHYFAEKYIEKNAKIHGLKYVIFRLTNSYGCPRDFYTDKWYLVLNDLCQQAYENKSIVLNSNGKALRDFIWMGDVVKVIDKSIYSDQCMSTVFNLSSGNTFDVLTLANIVNDAFSSIYKDKLVISVNRNDLSEYNNLIVSNEKLLNVIDYKVENNFFSEAKKTIRMLISHHE